VLDMRDIGRYADGRLPTGSSCSPHPPSMTCARCVHHHQPHQELRDAHRQAQGAGVQARLGGCVVTMVETNVVTIMML
jgi:hypothetical protein